MWLGRFHIGLADGRQETLSADNNGFQMRKMLEGERSHILAAIVSDRQRLELGEVGNQLGYRHVFK